MNLTQRVRNMMIVGGITGVYASLGWDIGETVRQDRITQTQGYYHAEDGRLLDRNTKKDDDTLLLLEPSQNRQTYAAWGAYGSLALFALGLTTAKPRESEYDGRRSS
jgi:hypothetical protein